MARTAIDVCNEALAMVGAKRIAALNDGSAEGEVCSAHYETVVGAALTVPGGAPMRWRFASKQARLAQMQATPESRWAYAYQMPPDLLRLHAVTVDGHVIEHDTYGDKLFCDHPDRLVADYTFRAPEAGWPADFAAAVVQELALKLALSLNRDADLAKMLQSTVNWAGPRTADSQARTSHRIRATRLTGARYSGGRAWR